MNAPLHATPDRSRRGAPHGARATRLGAFAFVAVLTLLAGCGAGSGDLGTVAPPPPTSVPSLDIPSSEPSPGTSTGPTSAPTSGPTTRPGDSPAPSPQGTMTLRVYFFLGSFTDNAGLVPVLRELPRTQAVGAATLRALLEGPNEGELGARPAMYTAIPDGTRFLGLRIEGGVAIVNLSREFESGGGSASVLGRLAQVVYTLTQFPTVDGVRFELDGEPVTVFGGQGVILDQPVDRADYLDQLPAIFVDRPVWGGVFASGGPVAGLANVFEAAFQIRVRDGAGRTLADEVVMATCGTGCWGTFDESLEFNIAAPGWGILEVFTHSAMDGSVIDLTTYPVWLTP